MSTNTARRGLEFQSVSALNRNPSKWPKFLNGLGATLAIVAFSLLFAYIFAEWWAPNTPTKEPVKAPIKKHVKLPTKGSRSD